MATTTRTTAKDTTACVGCGVPGCDNPADPAAFGVCLAHRAEELGAERNHVFGRTYDDLIHEMRRVKADEAQRLVRETAERLKQREREWWSDSSDRRGRAILRKIVQRFAEDVARGRSRNESLAAASWAAGRLVAGHELDEADARRDLLDAARGVGLPEHEARGVIRRRFVAAQQRPRVLAERRAA